MRAAAFFVTAFCVAPALVAAACPNWTVSQDDAVGQQVEQAASVGALHKILERWGDCLRGGGTMEAIDDRVMTLLATNWDAEMHQIRTASDRRGLTRFVLSRINGTGDFDTIRSILNNASQRCPVGQTKTCNSIAQRARAAMADIEPGSQ
jgi:hypothetical protein